MSSKFENLFTEEERQTIRDSLWATFDAIAFDLIPPRKTISRSVVVEVTLDANHLEIYGDRDRENKELFRRFRTLSYDQQKAVARTVFTSKGYCR